MSTSGGMATAQLKIPAIPPANRMLGTLSSLWLRGRINRLRAAFHAEPTDVKRGDTIYLFPAGVRRFFSHSYEVKYIPLAGTSGWQTRNVALISCDTVNAAKPEILSNDS